MKWNTSGSCILFFGSEICEKQLILFASTEYYHSLLREVTLKDIKTHSISISYTIIAKYWFILNSRDIAMYQH